MYLIKTDDISPILKWGLEQPEYTVICVNITFCSSISSISNITNNISVILYWHSTFVLFSCKALWKLFSCKEIKCEFYF